MLTIIISLYKSGRYIDKLSAKLLKISKNLQKNNLKFEIIIVFNDPDKAELNCIDRLKSEEWFRYLIVDRETVFASWNRALAIANGDVIAFWNADDTRFVGGLVDGYKHIKNGADLVYFPFYIIWVLRFGKLAIPVKYKHILPPPFTKEEFTQSMHCGPFFMISKDFYNKVGSFDEAFTISGDLDWCIRAAKTSDKFILSDKDAGIFNVDGRGLSAGVNPRLVAENEIIYKRYGIAK